MVRIPLSSPTPPYTPHPTFPAWVNVRDHGARGDGSHDDTDAIRRAIQASMVDHHFYSLGPSVGAHACARTSAPAMSPFAHTKASTVFFPAGTYIVTGTIEVDSGLVIRGSGPGCTTIRMSGAADMFVGVGSRTKARRHRTAVREAMGMQQKGRRGEGNDHNDNGDGDGDNGGGGGGDGDGGGGGGDGGGDGNHTAAVDASIGGGRVVTEAPVLTDGTDTHVTIGNTTDHMIPERGETLTDVPETLAEPLADDHVDDEDDMNDVDDHRPYVSFHDIELHGGWEPSVDPSLSISSLLGMTCDNGSIDTFISPHTHPDAHTHAHTPHTHADPSDAPPLSGVRVEEGDGEVTVRMPAHGGCYKSLYFSTNRAGDTTDVGPCDILRTHGQPIIFVTDTETAKQVNGERGLCISPWLPEDPHGHWRTKEHTITLQVYRRGDLIGGEMGQVVLSNCHLVGARRHGVCLTNITPLSNNNTSGCSYMSSACAGVPPSRVVRGRKASMSGICYQPAVCSPRGVLNGLNGGVSGCGGGQQGVYTNSGHEAVYTTYNGAQAVYGSSSSSGAQSGNHHYVQHTHGNGGGGGGVYSSSPKGTYASSGYTGTSYNPAHAHANTHAHTHTASPPGGGGGVGSGWDCRGPSPAPLVSFLLTDRRSILHSGVSSVLAGGENQIKSCKISGCQGSGLIMWGAGCGVVSDSWVCESGASNVYVREAAGVRMSNLLLEAAGGWNLLAEFCPSVQLTDSELWGGRMGNIRADRCEWARVSNLKVGDPGFGVLAVPRPPSLMASPRNDSPVYPYSPSQHGRASCAVVMSAAHGPNAVGGGAVGNWHALGNRSAVFFRGVDKKGGEMSGGLVLSNLVMDSAIDAWEHIATGPIVEVRGPSTNSSVCQVEYSHYIRFGRSGTLVDEGGDDDGGGRTIVRAFRGQADRG